MNWSLLSMLLQSKLTIIKDLDRIHKLGRSIFGVDVYGNIPDSNAESHEKELLHKYVITIERKPGITENEKISSLVQFLRLITPNYPSKEVEDCIMEARIIHSIPPINLAFFLKNPNEHLKKFEARGYHQQITTHCLALFESKHYQQAVLEACKAYCAAVRRNSGNTKDGQALMNEAFGPNGTRNASPLFTKFLLNRLQ